jgi:hypothetical protein
MIIKQLASTKIMGLNGWLTTDSSTVINLPTSSDGVDFCVCSFMCEYEESAWVYPVDASNSYKNDYKGIITTLLDNSSTYAFKLIDGLGNEIDLIDNTYGELFPVGFNASQPLKVGYRIDWVDVYNLHGYGKYKIQVSQTDFGNTVISTSHRFNVRVFNELASNNSIKLETVQSGVILNGEDFGGMQWRNMTRLRGKFGLLAPEYDINRLVDSSNKDVDIQTTKFNKYNMEVELVPSSVGNILMNENVLTDEIYISVNDIFNYEQYRRLPVVFDGNVEPSDDNVRNNMKYFNISFKDRFSKMKRNFV